MKELKDIQDDEIRVIGTDEKKAPKFSMGRRWLWVLLFLAAAILAGLWWGLTHQQHQLEELKATAAEVAEEMQETEPQWIGEEVDPQTKGYTEIKDTVMNNRPLRLYIPHNADMELYIGKLNKKDTDIIYAAQAADVRADNGHIVGAFVLKGTPKAWGLSKRGYCASINGKVTVGVADNSPLFEEATEKNGYFFRQYPLVKNGKLIESELKSKTVRRAICERKGEIFMAESLSDETMHNFSQDLIDLGVNQAIYLVGSAAYGWAVDEKGERHEFGKERFYSRKRFRRAPQINYILWRRK